MYGQTHRLSGGVWWDLFGFSFGVSGEVYVFYVGTRLSGLQRSKEIFTLSVKLEV